MRVNVYKEELTGQVEVVAVEPFPGRRYIGLRFILESAPTLHNTAEDDDRSAVTLWVGSKAQAHQLLDTAEQALEAF